MKTVEETNDDTLCISQVERKDAEDQCSRDWYAEELAAVHQNSWFFLYGTADPLLYPLSCFMAGRQ